MTFQVYAEEFFSPEMKRKRREARLGALCNNVDLNATPALRGPQLNGDTDSNANSKRRSVKEIFREADDEYDECADVLLILDS
jgi:hypothetical protein